MGQPWVTANLEGLANTLSQLHDKAQILEAQGDAEFNSTTGNLHVCRNFWKEAAECEKESIGKEMVQFSEENILYRDKAPNAQEPNVQKHIEIMSVLNIACVRLYQKARSFADGYKYVENALEAHKTWEWYKLNEEAVRYLTEFLKNAPPMAANGYTQQDGCWDCEHCFERDEHDEERSYYCSFGALQRPPCMSVAMKETTEYIEGEPREEEFERFHVASSMWDKWSRNREVCREGKCKKWEKLS